MNATLRTYSRPFGRTTNEKQEHNRQMMLDTQYWRNRANRWQEMADTNWKNNHRATAYTCMVAAVDASKKAVEYALQIDAS